MDNRSRRRHHAIRVIKKRTEIMLRMHRWLDPSYYPERPGKFRKWNLSCNCFLCKYEKKLRIKTFKEKARIREFYNQLSSSDFTGIKGEVSDLDGTLLDGLENQNYLAI